MITIMLHIGTMKVTPIFLNTALLFARKRGGEEGVKKACGGSLGRACG